MRPNGNFAHRVSDLVVYQLAFRTAMEIFRHSKRFPSEERYSLTDQLRRATRSVCANLAEAWAKRIYPAAFVSKINDAEGEAAEVQTFLKFALECEYLSKEDATRLIAPYDEIVGILISMRRNPGKWVIEN